MKKFLKPLIIAVCSFAFSFQGKAQLTSTYVANLMALDGWTNSGFSRYAYLKEDEFTSWVSRYFYEGTEYAIVAFSEDDNVLDVDADLASGYGTIIDSDNDESDLAVVYYTPLSSGYRKIRITNSSSAYPALSSKCFFMIFYR